MASVVFLLLSGCNGTRCGAGTMRDGNGECVPVAVDGGARITCGAGTHAENGMCLPDCDGGLHCGMGTRIEGDLCVPGDLDAGFHCGPGTHLDGLTCLPGDPIDAIALTPADATLLARQTVAITATPMRGGAAVEGIALTWTSDATDVATVDDTGLVTALAPGVAHVTASAQGIDSDPATITVNPGPAFHIDALDPVSGPGGVRVAIDGSAFGDVPGTAEVRFGAVAATVLSWSDTRIVTRVPYGLEEGSADVVVTAPDGMSNTVPFTVTSDPYVAGVAPSSTRQGTSLTIRVSGSNLSECTIELLRDGAADPSVIVGATTVESSDVAGTPDRLRADVDVAADASVGELAVVCGSSSASEDDRFTILPRPGTITALAGSGTAGLSGDGGDASIAELDSPSALALGASGELYVADEGNHRVRVVNTTESAITRAGVTITAGAIATIAGGAGVDGEPGFEGDSGPAAMARLHAPKALAHDGARELLFVADASNHCVRVINLGASDAMLASGTIAAGTIATVAGTCTMRGSAGDGGAATDALLDTPSGVAADASGLVYLADTGNHRVRVVNTSASAVTNGLGTFAPGTIALVAGSGSAGAGGDDARAGASTELDAPTSLALTDDGLLLISDTGNDSVRVINTASAARRFGGPSSADGGVGLNLLAGYVTRAIGVGGAPSFSGDGWPCTGSSPYPGGGSYFFASQCARMAGLAGPRGLAVGPFGTVLVADEGNGRVRAAVLGDAPIRRMRAWLYSGGIDTIAGDGTLGSAPGFGDGGDARSAALFGPLGVAYDRARGALYVADTLHHRVRRVQFEEPADPYSGAQGAWPTTLVATGEGTLDTDTGVLRWTPEGGSETEVRLGVTNGVLSFDGDVRVFAGTTLTIVGSQPAVIAATGELRVEGTIHVDSGAMPSGPGIGQDTDQAAGNGHGARGPAGLRCGAFQYSSLGGAAYGSPELVPITAGTGAFDAGGGLVLSAGTASDPHALTVSGTIEADSGTSDACDHAGGSGGGIRLVATGSVAMSGALSAAPGMRIDGAGGSACCTSTYAPASGAAVGRIRIEAPSVTATGTSTPAASIATSAPIPPPWI